MSGLPLQHGGRAPGLYPGGPGSNPGGGSGELTPTGGHVQGAGWQSFPALFALRGADRREIRAGVGRTARPMPPAEQGQGCKTGARPELGIPLAGSFWPRGTRDSRIDGIALNAGGIDAGVTAGETAHILPTGRRSALGGRRVGSSRGGSIPPEGT